jgi:hypothetical protein
MGLMLDEDIWHLGGGGEIGTVIGLVMIDAVSGNGNRLRLRGDRNRGGRLWPPVVGMRRMIRRVKVRGGRGNRKGRQVGQFEGFLFCTEGSVDGMGGRSFTVISILRGYVCCYGYGRIVRSRGGRVAHPSSSNRRKGFGQSPYQFLFSRANGGSLVCSSVWS